MNIWVIPTQSKPPIKKQFQGWGLIHIKWIRKYNLALVF